MKIKPFKGIYPDYTLIKDVDSFFSTVKDRFADYRASGFYLQDEEEAMFLYRVDSQAGGFTGLIAANDLVDYDKARIKRHENTLASKEQVLMEFTLQRKAMIKPVLLGFQEKEWWHSFVDRESKEKYWLRFDFKNPKEKHTLWKIRGKENLAALRKMWQNRVKEAYIADGHHRCTTAQIIRDNRRKHDLHPVPENLLVLYMPFSQLKIFDYNRIIDLVDLFPPSKFMALLHKKMKIKLVSKSRKPRKRHELTFFLEGQWYRAKWRKKIIKNYRKSEETLDIFLFNQEILGDILGISDIRDNPRIRNIPGIFGVEGIENTLAGIATSIGFMIPPLTMEEIKIVADQGEILPPKSSWFEPRVKNGLVVLGM